VLSSQALMSVSSVWSAALLGAGSSTASLRRSNLRRTSGESFTPSKRFALRAKSVTAAIRSFFAPAAICSVSAVMKFCCTQSARSLAMPKARRRVSTSSMKDLASAAVGDLPPGPGGAAAEATPRPGATPIKSADRSVTARTVGRQSLGARAAMETSPEMKFGCRERRKVSRACRRRQGGPGPAGRRFT